MAIWLIFGWSGKNLCSQAASVGEQVNSFNERCDVQHMECREIIGHEICHGERLFSKAVEVH